MDGGPVVVGRFPALSSCSDFQACEDSMGCTTEGGSRVL